MPSVSPHQPQAPEAVLRSGVLRELVWSRPHSIPSEISSETSSEQAPPEPEAFLERNADSASDGALDAELPQQNLLVTVAAQKSPESSGHALVRYEAGVIIGGKYELSELLGEGGMGWVFGAQNLTLGVPVAVKLMRSDLARETHGLTERMLQEAQAAASLGHPSIIRVLDFGFTECADPYIVMERLEGESLSRRLHRRGPIRAARAVEVLLPIIDALAEAHDAEIVHRDIKPENIFLARRATGASASGRGVQPKLLDFGIAKWTSRASARLTREGTILGSPAYMAPEQVRGEPDIDGRVDQWSVCVVIYETITGRRPFEAENYHAEMWSILTSEPKPLSAHDVHEPALWRILSRGLSKERANRYASLHDLHDALENWLRMRRTGQGATTSTDSAPESTAAAAPSSAANATEPRKISGGVEGLVLGLFASRSGRLNESVAGQALAEQEVPLARVRNGRNSIRWPWWLAGVFVLIVSGASVWLWSSFFGEPTASDDAEEPESIPAAPRRARHARATRPLAPLPTTGPQAPLLYLEPRDGRARGANPPRESPKPGSPSMHDVKPTEDL
ncbi:MAG TPA: serine/threonine-protein kinase [Polyangiaceae bacterium]|nr:serine/threonine-protein kinase [Polyangiaceae bacterium]